MFAALIAAVNRLAEATVEVSRAASRFTNEFGGPTEIPPRRQWVTAVDPRGCWHEGPAALTPEMFRRAWNAINPEAEVVQAVGFDNRFRVSFDGRTWAPLDPGLRMNVSQETFPLRSMFDPGRERVVYGRRRYELIFQMDRAQLEELGRPLITRGQQLPGTLFVVEQVIGRGHPTNEAITTRQVFQVTEIRMDYDAIFRDRFTLRAEGYGEPVVLGENGADRMDREAADRWTRQWMERGQRQVQEQVGGYFDQMLRWDMNPWIPSLPPEDPAATKRAEELLDAHLTGDQRRSLKEKGYFDVQAPSGQVYRLRRGHQNVTKLNANGRIGRKLCIVTARTTYPMGDVLLTQKLLIETDEEKFLKTANDMGEVRERG